MTIIELQGSGGNVISTFPVVVIGRLLNEGGQHYSLTCSLKECPSLLCADHSVSHLLPSMTPLPPQVL